MRLIDADELYARLMNRYLMHNMKGDRLDMAARAVIGSCMEAVDRRKTVTITPPPNDPLTLEELREMDREPVWLSGDELNRYDIFRGERSPGWADFYCGRFSLFCYGKDWLAYRRKPEEGN